ncbi:hypothetical protein [Actinomadura macrotermitis]|uniref:Uncharacterized protein n=1 Tax=Actinomadura macrotermitis TaxID=2585200 RepID=A0A7K0C4K4_9ACTN|nr:hypothetical protein [Actinomadura macrotermitis]MQY08370.1 hypothetical protein [Actinomadura macrotermitis]
MNGSSAARRFAGYGAALAMSCYLSVKIGWVALVLLGHAAPGMRRAEWAVLNGVTAVMATLGVALVLAQPLGRRIPAPPLLLGDFGFGALLAAGSGWALTSRRALPTGIPVTIGFVTSGMLFAWSAWKLPLALLRPGGYAPPEHLAVAVVEHGLGIGAGVALLRLLLKTVRARAAGVDDRRT